MNSRTCVIVVALAVSLPWTAQAHKLWILPSATVLASDSWVTMDAAVSNDLFHFNHVPLRLDNLVITSPQGTVVPAENAHTGKYRSTFDLHLARDGTYKAAVSNGGLNASYEVDGDRKRWRGTAQAFAREVPKDAKNLDVAESLNRIETFVTAGKPNDLALNPAGKGLELAPITHPNDLFAGEAARFRLLVDGRPAVGVEVAIVPGGTRYRDTQDDITITTDAQGEFAVTWPQPGMYWLEATMKDDRTSVPQAKERRLGYAATFEVLPP